MVEEGSTRDVLHRETEAAAPPGERLASRVDAKVIVDALDHPGDGLPVGRRPEGVGS